MTSVCTVVDERLAHSCASGAHSEEERVVQVDRVGLLVRLRSREEVLVLRPNVLVVPLCDLDVQFHRLRVCVRRLRGLRAGRLDECLQRSASSRCEEESAARSRYEKRAEYVTEVGVIVTKEETVRERQHKRHHT